MIDFAGDNLTEVAHWTQDGSSFSGVYLHTIPADGGTYILGSDRGFGLRIFAWP